MGKTLLRVVLVLTLIAGAAGTRRFATLITHEYQHAHAVVSTLKLGAYPGPTGVRDADRRSEEHTSELQSPLN